MTGNLAPHNLSLLPSVNISWFSCVALKHAGLFFGSNGVIRGGRSPFLSRRDVSQTETPTLVLFAVTVVRVCDEYLECNGTISPDMNALTLKNQSINSAVSKLFLGDIYF